MSARTAVETIQAAIEKLEQITTALGLMVVMEDGDLFARADDDIDDDGNLYYYGLNLQGVDSDREINEALVTLHRTIDAQLAILHSEADLIPDEETSYDVHVLWLARSILGEES